MFAKVQAHLAGAKATESTDRRLSRNGKAAWLQVLITVPLVIAAVVWLRLQPQGKELEAQMMAEAKKESAATEALKPDPVMLLPAGKAFESDELLSIVKRPIQTRTSTPTRAFGIDTTGSNSWFEREN